MRGRLGRRSRRRGGTDTGLSPDMVHGVPVERGKTQTRLLYHGSLPALEYASVHFIRAVERTEYGGKRIVSKRGHGRLRAANPTDGGVAPMNIIGTAMLPLVFPPVDRVFRARVRVVEGLPFGLIY